MFKAEFKLLSFVAALFVAALVALAYFHFNPILTFVVISAGLYLFARKGGGALWPPDSAVQWRSGHGIYLRRDDQNVAGIEPDGTADADRREAQRR
jgi:hypothetical protein